MRVFVGGIHMEANSFNPNPANIETFRESQWLEGEEFFSQRMNGLEGKGVLSCFNQDPAIQVIPGLYARALAFGPIRAGEFEKMCDKLFADLRRALPVDGVLLLLHGACQSQTIDDCEGYILRKIRKIVGNDIPVVASLDLHACMTQEMMKNLDSVACYLTYPHNDHVETGYRAAQCLIKLIQEGIKPGKLLKNIPLIMSNINETSGSLLAPVMEMYRAFLKKPGVVSAGVLFTQPWLDTPEMGCQMCVFYDNEERREDYETQMDEIMQYLWEHRKELYVDQLSIEEALRKCDEMEKPICIVDYGDIPPSGSTGDSVAMLKALLEKDLDYPACVIIYDPETTKLAKKIGAGSKTVFRIGTNDGTGFNGRIPVEAEVMTVTDAPFRNIGPAQKDAIVNAGIRALLYSKNVYIVVCERIYMTHDRNMLITLGLEPEKLGIVVQKCSKSYKPNWAGIMKSEMDVDTPGYSRQKVENYRFEHVIHPIYPLDKI